MERFVRDEVCDGFILVPHITPGGLDGFADSVVPLLQERGVFRASYEGTTLREHLGLPPVGPGRGGVEATVWTHARGTRFVTGRRVPLSVLDLVPVPSGATAAQAVHNSIDLARRAEAMGYGRYWFAEHHLNPGVAGTTPAVMIGLAAAATSTIRVGSAGVQLGHRTPLSVVEEFGLLDCAYPGRLDLGLGRTRGTPRRSGPHGASPPYRRRRSGRSPQPPGLMRRRRFRPGRTGLQIAGRRPTREAHMVDGVLIPSPPPLERLRHSPRIALARDLLQQPEAITPGYTQQIGDILACSAASIDPTGSGGACDARRSAPGVQIWILGSSGGESAEVAGHKALRFAANYHVSPADRPGGRAVRTAPLFALDPNSTARTSACRSTSS